MIYVPRWLATSSSALLGSVRVLDGSSFAVNIHLVKALIQIVRCGCSRLPAFRYFLRSKRRGAV